MTGLTRAWEQTWLAVKMKVCQGRLMGGVGVSGRKSRCVCVKEVEVRMREGNIGV